MNKKYKEKANISYRKYDKAVAKSFFYTILFGIALAILIIYFVVRNSSDVYDLSNKLENVIEYAFGIFSILWAVSLLISVTKKK